MEIAASTYSLFDNTTRLVRSAFRRLDWLAPLLGRVTLGVLFMSTGWGKVHNLDKVAGFFTELGIPAPAFQATLVSYVELIGGALLLVGLLADFAAVPLIISMLVAIVTAKRDEVHGLPDLFGLVEWTYLVLLVWVVLAGAGKMSLDYYLLNRGRAHGKSASSNAPEQLAIHDGVA
jgi:putative oxidoreductase